MPLRGERKREYQQGYMARKRAEGQTSLRSVRPHPLKGNVRPTHWSDTGDTYFILHEDVRPTISKVLTNRKNIPGGMGLGRTKDAAWMRGYSAYVAARGLALVETGRGREMVDVVTGEVGVYGGGAWKGLGGLLERLTALERAYVQHQAEHVVQEAPKGYQEWLLEEEGIVEDDWELYRQHPTEHTLREGL